jgi:lysozyme
MNITDEGLDLIRRFEGFRTQAYRDAAGVWTIGYGHTSAAGSPKVKPAMKITRKEAEVILARDVRMFASAISAHIRKPLTDGQFSALVSFAYNVGVENFRKSSVLRAVNAGDFAAVPRRLSLWVRSRGRVLPGLINRRAAEAACFAEATPLPDPLSADASAAAVSDERDVRAIEPLPGKSLLRSSTALAALVSGLFGVASSLASGLSDLAERLSAPAFAVLSALIILAATIWILRERRLKSREEGI